MSAPVTFGRLINALEQNAQEYDLLPLHHGQRLVIMQRGGRLFGPFAPGDDAPPLCWINPALADAAAFRALIAAGEWNVGGERIWIAPEIQFHIRDRGDFWGTYAMPSAVDPGAYAIERASGRVHLRQGVTLHAYNLASGMKALAVSRTIQPADDPLRTLSHYPAGLTYAGYAHTVTLTETNDVPIVSETWNIVQLEPGGTLFIPTVSDHVEATAYFGTLPEEATTVRERRVQISITGKQQFKVGYQAACMTGRMGYYHELLDNSAYLIVRTFFNNPSALYSEEPPAAPGRNGHSVHVYNDGGDFGGCGEMECNGQAIGGSTNRASSTDTFLMWIYTGTPAAVRSAAHLLLGIQP